jgi:hypothetical protein
MELRLETPASRRQHEEWVAIMEGVQGDVFAAEEVAHFIETDPESAWLLAYRGDEAAGCGVGRPSSLAGSLYAMARVCPGTGARAWGAGSMRRSPITPAAWV